MGAFHAYDIRGVYGKDFDRGTAYKVGYFVPGLLGTDRVLVGRDCRVSSQEIHDALVEGICDAGADVFDLGLSSTPLVYFGTANYGFKASVQITASHNSAEYNGLKVSRENALPVGLDTGLGQIREWIESGRETPVAERRGKVVEMDIRKEYIDFQMRFKGDYSNLKIAFDLSNGMSGLFVKDIFRGDNAEFLFDTMDGRFPNHDPNPLIAKNVEPLRELVKRSGADVGVIYDGDADRVMFVDEKGGNTFPYATPATAAHVLSDAYGALWKNTSETTTVEIAAGAYCGDVCAWTANDLTIRGAGRETTILKADGRICRGKAIWVVTGTNVTVSGVTFTGAPDSTGKRPFVYVMGPSGKEPLCQGPFNDATIKEANAAIAKALKEIGEWDPKWRPFYGTVAEPKYNTSLAKALEKGKTAKVLPLAPVSKALLADVKSKDPERAKEAQILFDAIEQTRSDLKLRIQLEKGLAPHRAYYDLETLAKYWPAERKRLEMSCPGLAKMGPEIEAMGKMYCKLVEWNSPNFTCKNAGEAKKIVQELNKMKKALATAKESKNITVQNGALLLDVKIDELISSIPARVQSK